MWRKDLLGFHGRSVPNLRRFVETARGSRRKCGDRFKRAGADDWTHWNEGMGGRPVHGCAGAGCQLRAAVGCGVLLEGRRTAWVLKRSATPQHLPFPRV